MEPGAKWERGKYEHSDRYDDGRPGTHGVHDGEDTARSSRPEPMPMHTSMDGGGHGMEPAWCFLCRIERSGADPRIAWGLEARDDGGDPEDRPGPMTEGH